MSEVIIAALIAAGAKLASELLTKKPKNELQQPVVFSLHTSDPGDNLEQPSLRPTRLPDVYAPSGRLDNLLERVSFDLNFVPLDEESFEDLVAEQPVIVFIYNPEDPDEAVFSLTELGDGIRDGYLYPGTYGLLALVYFDESFEEIDAVGLAELTIGVGSPPLEINVPISSDENILDALLGEDTTVIGNQRSKVWHFPHCSGAYEMAAANRVFFPSPEAAHQHGYHPCEHCVEFEDEITAECPNCGQHLRMPSSEGVLELECPACGEQLNWFPEG